MDFCMFLFYAGGKKVKKKKKKKRRPFVGVNCPKRLIKVVLSCLSPTVYKALRLIVCVQ